MKFQIETKKKLHTLYLGYSFIRNSQQVQGYTNRCNDDMWVALLDMDGWKFADVVGNKDYIARKEDYEFDLLIQTNKGFHLVSFEKVDFHKLRRIYDLSLADPIFVKVPFNTYLHSSVLRIGEKDGSYPKLVCQFKREWNPKKELSLAHFEFMKKAFPEIAKPKGVWDDNKEIEVVSYWTKPSHEGKMKW